MPKNFTRKQAQAINLANADFKPMNKINEFDLTNSTMKKNLTYEYQHWGADKKVMEIINKLKKSPETLRSIGRWKELRKPGKLQIDFDSKSMGPQTSGQIWERRGGSKDSKLLFRNKEKKRLDGGYFELNEPKTISSTEQSKQEPENVSSIEESRVAKTSVNFPIVNLENCDLAVKTIHFIQVNHVSDNRKKRMPKPKKNRRRPSSTL